MSMTDATFTETDVISLGEKLASLRLTDGERAALAHLINEANEPEVAAFGRFNFGARLARGIRIVPEGSEQRTGWVYVGTPMSP